MIIVVMCCLLPLSLFAQTENDSIQYTVAKATSNRQAFEIGSHFIGDQYPFKTYDELSKTILKPLQMMYKDLTFKITHTPVSGKADENRFNQMVITNTKQLSDICISCIRQALAEGKFTQASIYYDFLDNIFLGHGTFYTEKPVDILHNNTVEAAKLLYNSWISMSKSINTMMQDYTMLVLKKEWVFPPGTDWEEPNSTVHIKLNYVSSSYEENLSSNMAKLKNLEKNPGKGYQFPPNPFGLDGITEQYEYKYSIASLAKKGLKDIGTVLIRIGDDIGS
ncbi:MAG: hypothetical protein DRH43_11630, partial [Deltaproteobacteria bacterium]